MARAIWGPKDFCHVPPCHPSPKRGRLHSMSSTNTAPIGALVCAGIRRFTPAFTRCPPGLLCWTVPGLVLSIRVRAAGPSVLSARSCRSASRCPCSTHAFCGPIRPDRDRGGCWCEPGSRSPSRPAMASVSTPLDDCVNRLFSLQQIHSLNLAFDKSKQRKGYLAYGARRRKRRRRGRPFRYGPKRGLGGSPENLR